LAVVFSKAGDPKAGITLSKLKLKVEEEVDISAASKALTYHVWFPEVREDEALE